MPRVQRRAQLLVVAKELFGGYGYHHISMDDIADRAGVSKPVLYRHFPSKLELYLAIIDEQGNALVQSVRSTLEPLLAAPPGTRVADLDARDVDGLAVIEGIVRAYVEYALSAGASSSVLFESDVMRDPVVRARVLEPDEINSRVFADVLVRITDLTPQEAQLIGRTCTSIARVAAAETVRSDRDITEDVVTRLVPHLAWRGVYGMLRREPAPER
jgi:AcrR family transcriptional regulator